MQIFACVQYMSTCLQHVCKLDVCTRIFFAVHTKIGTLLDECRTLWGEPERVQYCCMEQLHEHVFLGLHGAGACA